MCQVHNTRAGTRLSKCYFRRCIIVTPSRNAVTLMLRTTGSSGTRRKTPDAYATADDDDVDDEWWKTGCAKQRVIHGWWYVARNYNCPRSRICPGNERKSPGVLSPIFRYALTYDGTRLKCTRPDIFQQRRNFITRAGLYTRSFY